MRWVVGTGSSPALALVFGFVFLLMEHFEHASFEAIIVTFFGTMVWTELARIRDELRKKEGVGDGGLETGFGGTEG